MAGWSVWPASTFTTGNMSIAISSKHIRLIGEGFLGIILGQHGMVEPHKKVGMILFGVQ
jgi:hypothetical protein